MSCATISKCLHLTQTHTNHKVSTTSQIRQHVMTHVTNRGHGSIWTLCTTEFMDGLALMCWHFTGDTESTALTETNLWNLGQIVLLNTGASTHTTAQDTRLFWPFTWWVVHSHGGQLLDTVRYYNVTPNCWVNQ